MHRIASDASRAKRWINMRIVRKKILRKCYFFSLIIIFATYI